ncbi:MAG: S-layer homology domain-containing protein [Oscillospiraceae bacterium]|nr:S-layer homology domain-containing protein [Oscillospiraceae bacterium]
MHTKTNHHFRTVITALLAVVMLLSLMPSAFAAQENSYHDPAEHWLTANNRTNELDANATVTRETFTCGECGKATSFEVYRTPEYTRNGQTAMTRNVKYSNGMSVDGVTLGSILDGTPGVDTYYTDYHWTKAVCENCGTINSNMSKSDYGYGKNVYWLYDCAAEFMEKLPETVTYEYTDSTYHTKTTTGGEYCCFCYGTHHTAKSVLERHDLEKTIVPQLANQRFVVTESCSLCDYSKTSYVAAKSIIANYFGVVDGKPHTVTVSDLSDAGVSTSIRYGNSAESCTLTSAPNYTEEGQYTVYYAITYTYSGKSMTENGVAYVWLRDEATNADGSCGCGCGNPNCGCHDHNCGGNCCNTGCTDHHYVLLNGTKASCLTLGYDRYLCTKCGQIEKKDYTAALGHAWQSVVIREATCETDGKLLEICSRCGEVKTTATPKGEHSYKTYTVAATCTSPGYTVKECEICGDRHITNITPALAHNYETVVTPATCDAGGHTTHICYSCGSSFVTDYTDALGHSWDKGTVITTATCDGSGVTEYRCVRCGYHRLEGDAANGHVPGPAATCTTPQTCTKCGVVLAVATGHKPGDWIIDKEPTTDSEGSKHKECEICHEKLETVTIEKLYMQATTDSKGEAVVGGYLVTVTDTDTKNPVANATVTLNKDNTLAIRLPDGRLLDYADQTTVTVQLVKDKSAVSGMSIAVTDKNSNYSAAITDKNGQITVPGTSGKTNGDATVGYEDADGNRFTVTVKVEDHETGRPIKDAAVSIGKTGNITVVLPDGTDMDKDNRIDITVTDNKDKPKKDKDVTVKNDLGASATGKTDEDGKLTVPAVAETERHAAYIVGYPDGTFGPERSMTRSEAAAIFARLLSAKNGDTISTTTTTNFKDIPANAWYSGYVKYLTGYGIAAGYSDKTYRPGEAITRAEFTAMAVRFFDAYGDGDADIMEQYKSFNDVSDGYWAAEYIKDAAIHGWIVGYGDGSFRADDEITRAEVVTIVNRLLGREADSEYIADNLRKLTTFTDMSKRHWAYYAVMESANGHTATDLDGAESWSK